MGKIGSTKSVIWLPAGEDSAALASGRLKRNTDTNDHVSRGIGNRYVFEDEKVSMFYMIDMVSTVSIRVVSIALEASHSALILADDMWIRVYQTVADSHSSSHRKIEL